MEKELKQNLEKTMAKTLAKLETDAEPYIYSISEDENNQVLVVFNDEEVGLIIAGYIPVKVYDEWEEDIKKLGYYIVDSDGSNLTISKCTQ